MEQQQQQQAFFCQTCRARLVLVRGETDGGDKRHPESWAALNASVFDTGKTYESFIVLDDRRPGGAAALPTAAGSVPPANRSLEESFVVLPGAASVLRPGPAAAAAQAAATAHAAAAHGSGLQQQQQPGDSPAAASGAPTAHTCPASTSAAAAAAPDRTDRSSATNAPSSSSAGGSSSSTRAAGGGLDAKLDTLASLCELASSVTGVDHPLCLDCAAQLREEDEAQVAELEGEIGAYSDALGQLGAEVQAALSEVRGWLRCQVVWCTVAGYAVQVAVTTAAAAAAAAGAGQLWAAKDAS